MRRCSEEVFNEIRTRYEIQRENESDSEREKERVRE